jgi:hypothetical protein
MPGFAGFYGWPPLQTRTGHRCHGQWLTLCDNAIVDNCYAKV